MGSPAVDATLNGMISSGSEEIVTPDEVHVWLYLCTSRCVTSLISLYQAKKIELEILSEWLRGLEPARDAEYGLPILAFCVCSHLVFAYVQVSSRNHADPRCK